MITIALVKCQLEIGDFRGLIIQNKHGINRMNKHTYNDMLTQVIKEAEPGGGWWVKNNLSVV